MTETLHRTNNNDVFIDLFQDYTSDCLRQQDQDVSESLRRRHIPANKIHPLEEDYNISLKLGKSFSLKSIKKPILKQVEATAYFLRDFQIGLLGQRTSIFHIYEIEIQVERNITSAFIFESGKLFIQIPYWQMSFLGRYLPYQELKNRWNRGEHLPVGSPARKIWWLLNPIGEFRSSLRAMLWLAVQKQILGIDKLFYKFGLADIDDQLTLSAKDNEPKPKSFKEGAIAFLKANVNENKIGVNLDLTLRNKDDADLVRLLSLFKQNLTDPGQMEELIEAGTLTLQEVLHEEQSQVEIKMLGFVNVGNYHRIDVALNLSAGYLKKYVELIPRKTDVKAVLYGFVNVYTIDDITVKPNFHGAMKLDYEAAALERALQELELATPE